MKKMIYIMGVEWNWIFQRPQILAEYLQEDYELTIVCPKQMVHGERSSNDKPERLIELLQIPFQEKISFIGKIANYFHQKQLQSIGKFDIIWVGYPLFARYIPNDYQGMIIYDCMDNHEALFPDQREKMRNRLMREEKRLVERADIIFVSSLKLEEKIKHICSGKESILIRNGFSNIVISNPLPGEIKNTYHLGYIGTISEWFDSKLLADSCTQIPSIHYKLIGPVDGRHHRIQKDEVEYTGVIDHANLGTEVAKLDCLIMPFVVNDIILYVDPVKLYEYIAWGKCIIASWYPEIDRFGDYVYFYHNKEEYLRILSQLSETGFSPKYNEEQQKAFLAKNTWKARAELIKREIDARV